MHAKSTPTYICEQCGKVFTPKHRPGNPARFCSRPCHCRANNTRFPPVAERFWSKIEKANDPDACWVWTAGRESKMGYGKFTIAKRIVFAHRFSWELANGAIPDGLRVLHKCDNPPCVNPAHLFLGTIQDNTDDKIAKWRHPHGESNHTSKLTENQVLEVRSRYANGETNVSALSREFGVSDTAIDSVVKRKTWRHV